MHIAHNYFLYFIFNLNINHFVFTPYSHCSYAYTVSQTRTESTSSIIKQEEGNCGNVHVVSFSRSWFLETVLTLSLCAFSHELKADTLADTSASADTILQAEQSSLSSKFYYCFAELCYWIPDKFLINIHLAFSQGVALSWALPALPHNPEWLWELVQCNASDTATFSSTTV